MKIDKNKIEFTCEKCGDCCKIEGLVTLKWGEAEKMAAYMSISSGDFKKKYTEYIWFEGRVLKQVGTECVFIVDGRCVVYPVRPCQCIEYPFWDHVLKDHEEWEHLKTFCPGVRNAKIK